MIAPGSARSFDPRWNRIAARWPSLANSFAVPVFATIRAHMLIPRSEDACAAAANDVMTIAGRIRRQRDLVGVRSRCLIDHARTVGTSRPHAQVDAAACGSRRRLSDGRTVIHNYGHGGSALPYPGAAPNVLNWRRTNSRQVNSIAWKER